MNYSSMNKSQLIQVLTDRGHKFGFLVRMGVGQLRTLAESGKHYTGPTEPNGPATVATEPEPATSVAPATATAPPAAPSVTVTPTGSKSATSALLDALAADLGPAVMATVQPKIDAILAEVDRKISTLSAPRPVEVRAVDMPPINVGIQHEAYGRLLKMMVGTKRPIYLHGPAGSGKSKLAENLATGIAAVIGQAVEFESAAFGPGSQPYELLGIPGLNGHAPQKSALWRGWTVPSVVLLDELDAAPDLFLCLNNGLANNRMTFADGLHYAKDAHCYVMAAGNTTMTGATDQYTSRQRQDKATIDRFLFVPLAYDEQLENSITVHAKWTKHVQALRSALQSLGASAPDLLISPRASIMGGELLTACPEMTFAEVEDIVIWRGCTADDKARVRKAVK